VAVFEEGDLQYIGVVALGGVTITNDLAIGLKTDPEIAEKVKVAHAVAVPRKTSEHVTLKHEKEIHGFDTSDIDEIVEARLEEIFDAVLKELKKAGRAGQLPSGIVLTGGTAKMKNIAEYAKEKLGLAARVGKASGYGGVAEKIDEPQLATAVGLMLMDAQGGAAAHTSLSRKVSGGESGKGKAVLKTASGAISAFLSKFKA
jgi:cell division protein FtsA